MLCDNCHEREAAIHLTQIVDNSVSTAHLCEQCAAEKGVHTGSSISNLPLSGLLGGTGPGAAATLPPDADAGSCSLCGATLRDFRETGRLGCSHCYATFEPHLRELLRRIHGATHHVGKLYMTSTSPREGEVPRVLSDLREQLRRAVTAENFEFAAELRDRIKALE